MYVTGDLELRLCNKLDGKSAEIVAKSTWDREYEKLMHHHGQLQQCGVHFAWAWMKYTSGKRHTDMNKML